MKASDARPGRFVVDRDGKRWQVLAAHPEPGKRWLLGPNQATRAAHVKELAPATVQRS